MNLQVSGGPNDETSESFREAFARKRIPEVGRNHVKNISNLQQLYITVYHRVAVFALQHITAYYSAMFGS